MAVTPGPLKRRHGVLLYSPQPVKDTPVTPATAVGMATPRATSDSGMNNVWGVGSASVLFMRPGLMQVPIAIPIDHLQPKAFLMRALRATISPFEVPMNTIAIGYVDDAAVKYQWQVDNFKIHSVDLAVEAGGPVTATFNGVGDLITVLSGGTGLSASNLAEEPYKWYDGLFTKDGAAYEAESFRVTVNHNFTPQPVLYGTAPTTRKRSIKYWTEGNEDITFEFVRFVQSGVSLQGDTIADADYVAAFTNGANTMTIALTDAKPITEEIGIDEDLRWTVGSRAKTWLVS